MKKEGGIANEFPAIKAKHLVLGFFASFLLAMTSTMLYGSSVVFMKSATGINEDYIIGLTIPNTNKGTVAYDSSGGVANGGRRIEVSPSTQATRTTTLRETINECGNTERWLNSRRYANIHNDSLFTEELSKALILNLDNILIPKSGQLPHILDQTLCHENSRFLNATTPTTINQRTVRLWAFKLIYLSIHYHQHRLAIPEAMARYEYSKCPSSETLKEKHGVGLFDYECPDAKYIALPLGGNGLGSNIRGGTVLAYLLGLEDYQCFFMPTTPCTVTQDELGMAYKLTNKEFRKIMKLGSRLEERAHHKIWTLNSQFVPIWYYPRTAMQLLQKYAKHLISAVSETEYPEYVWVLREAAKTIGMKDEPRDGYNYAAASFKMHHALTLYSLRPNPESSDKLSKVMKRIMPTTLRPDFSIGLPIRASDKCEWESECLSFEQHMEVVNGLWKKDQIHATAQETSGIPSVVFTTESRSMVEAQQDYASSMISKSFDFVTNSKDVLPDSGFMKAVAWKAHKNNRISDPDEIMLSAVSSLQLQLLPKVSIGNCCSNFHTMLNDLLSEGCGAAEDNTFVCLQEYEDPRLRVCCGWHHECKDNRARAIQELDASLNSTTL